MRRSIIVIIATREVRAAVRARWFLVGALSFALLAIAVTELGMAGAARWGVAALDRTTAALLSLVLLFIPLLALSLGAGSFASEAEDGTLAYLVAQPVSRSEVFLGKLLGLWVAMTLSLGFGVGATAAWAGFSGAVAGRTFGALALGAGLLAIVTVTLGTLLAFVTHNRTQALASAVAAWVALVFLCDFGVLALAAGQALGAGALFGIAVANPLQATKTLIALFVSARLEVLGPVGVYAVRTLGRPWLIGLLVASVAGWTLIAAGYAYVRFRKENLA